MDYTVHGILQARILEWVAFPFSRGSSQPKDWTQVSRIAGRFFSSWATVHVWGYWYFSQQSWSELVLHTAWHFTWCTLHVSWISRVTIYSLNVLLSQFGTSPLFHVQFCFFLTCIRFSQMAGEMLWYSHVFKDFPQFVVIHTVKGFSVVNEAEVDVFSGILMFSLWSKGC